MCFSVAVPPESNNIAEKAILCATTISASYNTFNNMLWYQAVALSNFS